MNAATILVRDSGNSRDNCSIASAGRFVIGPVQCNVILTTHKICRKWTHVQCSHVRGCSGRENRIVSGIGTDGFGDVVIAKIPSTYDYFPIYGNPFTWLTHLPHNWRHLIDPRPARYYPIACCRFEYYDRHFVEQRSPYLSVINRHNHGIRVMPSFLSMQQAGFNPTNSSLTLRRFSNFFGLETVEKKREITRNMARHNATSHRVSEYSDNTLR
jgi:hypothetical protein